jgi:hypothetical protein
LLLHVIGEILDVIIALVKLVVVIQVPAPLTGAPALALNKE